MGYAEVQNLYDFKCLRFSPSKQGRTEVLRIVLAIALDAEMATWCLGGARSVPVARWPSTLYQVVARAALESASVWRRCALLLDRSLHDALASYEGHAPSDLAELFAEGRESLAGEELAALLWCLVRERCPSRDLIAERLGRELETIAAQRLRESSTS